MRLHRSTTLFLFLALFFVTVLAQKDTSTSTNKAASTPSKTTSSPSTESTTESTTSAVESTTSEKSTSTSPKDVPPALTTDVSTSTPTSTPATTSPPVGTGTSTPPLPKVGSATSYAAPTVPPTANAPFMQRSSLPEGTFFIAVGAALGFLLFSVFAWRAIVAWSLHRSVRKAADEARQADSKTLLRPAPNTQNNNGGGGGGAGGFYATGAGSTFSLELGPTGRAGGGVNKPTPNSSLFFSPTAGVTGSAGGDRRSAYLPAGYYPTAGGAGSGAGGGLGSPLNGSQTHFHSPSISSRYGYGGGSRGNLGPSPPASPSIPPSRGNGSGLLPTLRGSESRTSLSLPPTAGVRAPSAYLEDLFENHREGAPLQQGGGTGGRF